MCLQVERELIPLSLENDALLNFISWEVPRYDIQFPFCGARSYSLKEIRFIVLQDGDLKVNSLTSKYAATRDDRLLLLTKLYGKTSPKPCESLLWKIRLVWQLISTVITNCCIMQISPLERPICVFVIVHKLRCIGAYINGDSI